MTRKSPAMNFSFYVTYLVTIIFLFSCQSIAVTKPSNAGLVTARVLYYDSILQKFVFSPTDWPERKLWYKDSLVIQELTGINLEENKQGKFMRQAVINGYLYIDLRSKSFYEYRSFSDTAKLQKKYTQPDSVTIEGGWNFYYAENFVADTYSPLSDTIIEGLEYKRYRFDNMWHSSEHSTIGYLRCDKKGSLFQFGRNFTDKLGCPIVRSDDYIVRKGQILSSTRIDFVRDSLTPYENKTFIAWEKNAKENPIH